jgi:arsenate reductase
VYNGKKDMKYKVLFICSHNSARSQMAEGYLRARYGDRYEAFSAGTQVTGVHPCAIQVMEECGIDISGHRSKGLSEFADIRMDIVVTVCDRAAGTCPVFPGAGKILNRSFPDPSASVQGGPGQIEGFRAVRDDIFRWVDDTFGPVDAG